MIEWTEFTEGLSQTLATLPVGAIVIISERVPRSENMRFAQFCWYDTGIHAEIPGGRRLTMAGEDGPRIVAGAGWHEPRSPWDGENWWTKVPWPAPTDSYRKLASMMVTALRDAYGIPNPDALEYNAWDEESENAPMELPLLGIRFHPGK
ncbi:TY-Chap domain-containing protein [Nocardia sp. CA-290969]|uniref:TY-Chap domain-containing protein n=1 Tax=Nocardia sp. CA-290969 TaxID=3239986 RepID=UPI003D8D08DA